MHNLHPSIRKDSRFSSYLPIENPSKEPGASRRRKLKSHSSSQIVIVYLVINLLTPYVDVYTEAVVISICIKQII